MNFYDVTELSLDTSETPVYIIEYPDKTRWETQNLAEAEAEQARYLEGEVKLEHHVGRKIHVEADVLYQNIVDRIVHILEGIRQHWADNGIAEPNYQDFQDTKRALGNLPPDLMPSELDAPILRGGGDRMYRLVRNALALPVEAWEWALIDRDQFYPNIPYQPKGDWLQSLEMSEESRTAVMRVQARGYALEIALGWYLHALRLKIGGSYSDIGRDLRYRL
jgi:hypothetical protein